MCIGLFKVYDLAVENRKSGSFPTEIFKFLTRFWKVHIIPVLVISGHLEAQYGLLSQREYWHLTKEQSGFNICLVSSEFRQE
jgi:ABC-type uncharacterized transport system permease subunit